MKKIGKYEIVDRLGEGGMGVVYKAFDPLMERMVAIKVLSESVFNLPEIKERFYREARSAGNLSHENIIIVYDVGEIDGKPYIVMEYLGGTDLRSIINNKKPLKLEQKLDYARQICKGLGFSHSQNTIHRDIKPENIRILDDGKVKIMDFGIAKPLTSTMTQTGTVMGTPHYMSPEQIKGEKVDRRADIFSFGVLFYELLTYKKPFPGDNLTTVTYKIIHEPPEEFDRSAIENIVDIRNIVLKCLSKNVNERYNDISNVAVELEGMIQFITSGKNKIVSAEAGTKLSDETISIYREAKESEAIVPRKATVKKKAIYLGAVLLTILVGVALLYRIFIYAPPPTVGYVALNILPWAEITKITNAKGEEVNGFSRGKDKMVTPYRLTLSAGNYTIYLSNPVLNKSLEIPIVVKKGEFQEIKRKIPGFDYNELLSSLE